MTAARSWSDNLRARPVLESLVFAWLTGLALSFPRVYVPMLSLPWVMHFCHALVFCHLGVRRTLRMLERVRRWVGMESCSVVVVSLPAAPSS